MSVSKVDRLRALACASNLLCQKGFDAEVIEQNIFLGTTRAQPNPPNPPNPRTPQTPQTHTSAAYRVAARRVLFNAAMAEDELRPIFHNEGVAMLGDDRLRSKAVSATLMEERERHMASLVLLKQSVDSVIVGGSDIVCKKCKSNAITVEQKQTRSADEGATVFFTCTACGSRWKIS